MKNKRGWLKIAEASIAVLIVASVVLIVLSRSEIQNKDISPAIGDAEISILREIELNNTLRAEILATSGEVEWTSFSSAAPKTEAKISSKIPDYLNCSAKICDSSSPCSMSEASGEDVYVESTLITSTLNTFNPRVLKLFCLKE